MKKIKVKPFKPKPLPTHFELTLTRKDKEGLKKVLDLLYEQGTVKFTWEYEYIDNDYQYSIYIEDYCWADNLKEIAILLIDHDYDKDEK